MSARITDLPLEALSVIVGPLETVDRLALVSTCTTLREQGARIPHLWASLQLAVPDSKLPQLAAWLDKKAPTIRSLLFDFQLQEGDWPALAAALQPLTGLTCLRLTDDHRRLWLCGSGGAPLNFRGLAFRSLRRLEVATSRYPLVQADVSLCDSLESMDISPDCHLGYVHSPPSLTRLSMPLKVHRYGEVVWDCAFRASVPGLRELQLWCSWSEGALKHFDDASWTRDPGGHVDGESLDLGELGELAPGLEVLAIDCSEAFEQREEDRLELGLAGARQLPKGLRSLTVTQLGYFSHGFLPGLSALLHLTQLCLPECHLHGVPRVLKGLTQLEELQLSGCTSDVVGPNLAPLRALPRLRRLSLAGSDL